MSLLPIVGTKVEIYSGSSLWLEAEPVELTIDQEITDSLDSASFVIERTFPDRLPDINHEVKLYLQYRNTSYVQKFRGYIEEKKTLEEGKTKKIRCFCHQLPLFNVRTTSVPAQYATQDSIIKSIVKPLVDDGIITVNNVASLGSKVSFEGARKQKIWPTLRRFLTENLPLVDCYLDYNQDLHAYYKIDTPASTETLDQTLADSTKILNIEYAENLKPVRNSILVIGEPKIIEKNNNKDYYTESTTNWSGTFWAYNYFYPLTPQLSTAEKTAGTYSIFITYDNFPLENLRGARLTLDNLDIPRLQFGGRLNVDILYDYYVLKWPWDFILGGTNPDCKAFFRLYDTSGAEQIAEREIAPGKWNHVTLQIGPGSPDFLRIPFDWANIKTLAIEVRNVWQGQDGDWIGEHSTDVRLWVDQLYFDECRTYYSYAVLDSINKYGLRPYTKRTKPGGLDTDDKCYEKARSIIDPIAYPEKSVRKVVTEGNENLRPGTKIYVRTEQVNNSYYIRKVKHIIRNFDYHTELELSSSLIEAPSKAEEIERLEIQERLRYLEDKLETLIQNVETPKETAILAAGTVRVSGSEIDWGYSGFNWNTLAKGVGVLATDVIRQMLAGGSVVWDSLIQALGVPFLNLFPSIGENMAYNGEFELDSDGDSIPDGWTTNFETTGGGATSEGLNSTIKQEGTYSYYMTCTTTQGDSIASMVIPVQPGRRYVFRCRARSDVATSKGFFFRVLWYANKTNIAREDAIAFENIVASRGLTTTFQEFSGKLTAPSGAYFARIACYNWLPDVEATFYFDSIWMFKEITWLEMIKDYLFKGATGLAKFGEDLITGLLGLPTHNMLLNPSFEYDRNNDGRPDHWIGYGANIQERSTDWSKEGQYSVKISSTATKYGGFVHTHLPNRKGHTYVCRAWLKAPTGTSVTVRFGIAFADSTKTNFAWTSKDYTVTDTETELECVASHSTAVYLQPFIELRTYSASVYLDAALMFKQISWLELIADSLLTPAKIVDNFFDSIIDQASKWSNNFWQGATGLAKWISGFWTADATGRGKFESLFVDTALIDTAAITSAKIATAAIETAHIQDAAITGLKIRDGTITFSKVDTKFGALSYFDHNKFIVAAESLVGYNSDVTGSGYVLTRKNYLKFGTGTTSYSSVTLWGHPIVHLGYNPRMKARVRVARTDVDIRLGIGYTTPNAIRIVFADDGYIKGVNYDNEGNMTVTVLQTYLANTDYIVEWRYTSGSKIEFYINGALKGTSTENLPSSTAIKEDCFFDVYNGALAVDQNMIVNFFTIQEDWM